MTDNGQDVLNVLPDLKPDVVIMNIGLPILNGIETTYHIRESHPDTKIILMTEKPEEDDIVTAFMAGAHGILLKEISPDDLYMTIHLVHQGQSVVSELVTDALKADLSKLIIDRTKMISERLSKRGIHLTEREVEVADLFRMGLTNEQMARQLNLKEGTIKNYMSNIYTAINCNNRKEAIIYLNDVLKYLNHH